MLGIGRLQPKRLTDNGIAQSEHQQRTEADAGQGGKRALSLDRLHQ